MFFGVRKAIDVYNNVFLIEQRKIKLVKYDIRKAFLWKQIQVIKLETIGPRR